MGIAAETFWGLSPRQLQRRIDGFIWRKEQEVQQAREEIEAHFFNTLNAVGLAFNGRKWTPVEPGDLKDQPSFEERWEAAMEREQAYIEHLNEQETD